MSHSRCGQFLTVAVLAFALTLSAAVEAAQAGRSYGESIRALKDKNWTKAEEKIREALQAESQELPSILISGSTRYPYLPYYVLGAARYGQGDCAGAVQAWEESLRQGHVRNSPNEFRDLESGLAQCRERLAQSTPAPAATAPTQDKPPPPVGEAVRVAQSEPKSPTGAQSQPQTGTQAPATAAAPVQATSKPVVDDRLQRLSDSIALALAELEDANARYAGLAKDRDLGPEWTAEWKPALDVSERERQRLAAAHQRAREQGDGAALQGIADELKRTTGSITASRVAAEERSDVLQADRVAKTAAREEERKRQEAQEEQRRVAAIREQEAADQRQQELEQRERLAAAQRALQQALAEAGEATGEAAGDARVAEARRALAAQVAAGQAMQASVDVDALNRQARDLRDSNRAYSQAKQEWEAAQREIALRTPPVELRRLAEAYFAGDYEAVLRMARPEKWPDKRQQVQSYLFRSAAKFNLYWLGGGQREELLTDSRNDISAIKRLDPEFKPYVAAFSPRYLRFFQEL